LQKTPRRSWIALAPAVTLVGLAAFVVGRFWLTDAPLPTIPGSQPQPDLPALPRLGERPPGAERLVGTVLDPAGAPVADVAVYASPAGVPTWDTTDAEGRFDLDWPPAEAVPEPREPVEVCVAAWGYPPLALPLEWGARTLEVRLPAPEEPTPRLPDGEASPLVLHARSALARPADEPLDLELWLEPVELPEFFSDAVSRRTRSSADGSFELESLAHGRYRARVLPAWAAGGSWPDLLGDPPVEIEHPLGTGVVVDLPLADGALQGALLDRDGAALEGALVLLEDAGNRGRLWPPLLTDENGRFRYPDLPAGVYQLLLSAGEGRLVEPSIELVAGAEVELDLPRLSTRAER
jgi:hypothetical protein